MSVEGWGAQCGRSCITSNKIFWSSHSMVTDGHCWEWIDEATVVLKCLWHWVLIEHSFRMKRNLVAYFFLTLLYWLYFPHLDYCMPKKGGQGVTCKETLKLFLEELRCTFRLLRIAVHQLSLDKGSSGCDSRSQAKSISLSPSEGLFRTAFNL